MDPWIALLAVLTGYLSGSISFARLISRIVAPGKDLSGVVVAVPGREARINSTSISATTVRMNLGTSYGCLTSILDMLKAFVPAMAFKIYQPELPYYLIAASMATIGHVLPIYHRFKGGRGLSPVLGGFMALDWVGTLLTNLIGMLVGIPMKNALVYSGLGIVLMIPWTLLRTQDPITFLYVLAMNIVYWGAMIPELREYARLKREGELEAFREARQLRVIRQGQEDRLENITLASIMDRINRLLNRDKWRGGIDQ